MSFELAGKLIEKFDVNQVSETLKKLKTREARNLLITLSSS